MLGRRCQQTERGNSEVSAALPALLHQWHRFCGRHLRCLSRRMREEAIHGAMRVQKVRWRKLHDESGDAGKSSLSAAADNNVRKPHFT